MADEFALFWMASFAFFRRLFVQLRTNNQCHVFLNAIRRGLKGRPNKLLAERSCSKLFSVKSYAQMRECFEGIKTFSFHVFASSVNLKVPTLDVELFVQLIATQNFLVFL